MQLTLTRPFRLAAVLAATMMLAAAAAQAQPPQSDKRASRDAKPTLTVCGEGEVAVDPDRAVVQLGAVAQEEEVPATQTHVNEIMQRAIEAIRDVGIDDKPIQTPGLSLSDASG